MNELMPYVGTTLVIVAVVFGLVVLTRHGLRFKKLKHGETELEFENLLDQKFSDTSKYDSTTTLSRPMIQLSSVAKNDCYALNIHDDEIIDFVLGEATRHPLLFQAVFTSLPIVFNRYVMLLSWDKSLAKIERILNREEAYPLNDAWGACLSLYRQATHLPYRTRATGQFHASTELSRTIALYRRLVLRVKEFQVLLRESDNNYPKLHQDLCSLIDEAEFAFANNNIGTTVAYLEAVLSGVHKLILDCAPQGPLSDSVATARSTRIQVSDEGKATLLVVDDEPHLLKLFCGFLESRGYAVVGFDETFDALTAMVEHEFDLVITDLVMPYGDGREVVIAAKNGSSRTKALVVTGYAETARVAQLYEVGADAILSKNKLRMAELLKTIEDLLKS